MKALGKAAIVLLILFLVFIIPAGILIAIGAKQAADDYDLETTFQNIFNEMDDYGSIHLGSECQFSGAYKPEGDIESIVLEHAAFEVKVARSGNSDFYIEHDGYYPGSLISEYNIFDGAVYYTDGSVNDSKSPFFFEEKDGVLTFGLETNYNFGNFNVSTARRSDCGSITIYLPDSFNGDFTINETAGEIELEDLELRELNIIKVAGELEATNCKVEKLTLSGIAGEVNYSGEIGALDFSGGMGDYDIYLTAPLTGESRISGTLGDVRISLPENSKLNISSNGNLGEISIDRGLIDSSGVPFVISGNLGEFKIDIDE